MTSRRPLLSFSEPTIDSTSSLCPARLLGAVGLIVVPVIPAVGVVIVVAASLGLAFVLLRFSAYRLWRLFTFTSTGNLVFLS